MSKRDNIHQFFNENGLEFTLIVTFITTSIYAIFIDYSTDSNIIIGKFVGIVLNGVTASASFVAFAGVIAASEDKWGEVAKLRTYIGIGSLIGLIASFVFLMQAFKGA